MKLSRSRSGSERGQVLVLTALMLAVLIGAVGLSIDIGFMMHTRTELQKDADAMALAGVQELCAPTPCGQDKADTKAREWGDKNGVKSSDTTVIQFGVDCDGGTSNPYVITVRLKRYQASFLARVVGYAGGDIGACATAGKFAIGGLSGVRPFGLEDNCIAEISYGDIVTLKNDSETVHTCDAFRGNFGQLDLESNGGNGIRDDVAYGSDTPVCAQVVPDCNSYLFQTTPGNDIGNTRQGLKYVDDNTPTDCDEWSEVVTGSGSGEKINPACNPFRSEYTGKATRLWIIPVVDGLWDSGGVNPVRIQSFAIVFWAGKWTDCSGGNKCDIKAIFVEASVNIPGDEKITYYKGATVTGVALIK